MYERFCLAFSVRYSVIVVLRIRLIEYATITEINESCVVTAIVMTKVLLSAVSMN